MITCIITTTSENNGLSIINSIVDLNAEIDETLELVIIDNLQLLSSNIINGLKTTAHETKTTIIAISKNTSIDGRNIRGNLFVLI